MRRRVRRLLDRHSPWRRGYDEGFDVGIWLAADCVDQLLSERTGSVITRDDVRELAAEIRRELS